MAHGAAVLLELGGVILGLGILGRLAGRLGLSAIPLYLLAGLAFGEGGLLPLVTASEFIEVGAEVGVILLLLLLGLEYSASELVGTLRTAAPAGLVDLGLNFTPGLLAGLLLGWSALAAVVLGGVTYVTSSGIVAKVLGDLNRLGNRETPVILSILVVEDLAMAAYLPLVTGLLVGGGLLASALPVGVALATVALVLLVAVRYGETLSRLVFTPNDEVLLLVILGLALVVAGVAQQLQVSAAVGAFLVGIALSGRAAEAAHDLLTPAARPVRGHLLRVLRAPDRPPLDPPGGPGRHRPGRGHGGHQGGHRLVGGPPGRDRPPGALAGRHRPGGQGRVLDRDRRPGRGRRPRARPRPAGHRLRADPGRARADAGPGLRAAADRPGPAAHSSCRAAIRSSSGG